MTETQFIEENKSKWKELEVLLTKKDKDPDLLHSLFVKVSSDLAYATTFYPKRSVRAYLNQLTQQVFDSMEDRKSQWSLEGVKNFFSHSLPLEMYRSRRVLLVSFLVFSLAVIIGVISSANNPDFLRVILGDGYVDMTNENINNGDPMAVYKGSEQSDMFFGITINNIKVAFLCFILGLFGSVGTIIVLVTNGIMLGAFQYYFYSKGLFMESFLTIWIHGTIEISAIIIAGAAGMVLGNGLLFPKTYSRATSLQIAAKRSIWIIIGTVPLFIIAGFLESFVTRLTDMPTFLKVLILLLSLAYILGLYVIFPKWYYRTIMEENEETNVIPERVNSLNFRKDQPRDFAENIAITFSQFRTFLKDYMKYGAIPVSLCLAVCMVIYIISNTQSDSSVLEDYGTLMSNSNGGIFLFSVYLIGISFCFMIADMLYKEEQLSRMNILRHVKFHLPVIMSILLIPGMIIYFGNIGWLLVTFVALPPQLLIIMINEAPSKGWNVWSNISTSYKLAFNNWFLYILGFVSMAIFHLLIMTVISSQIGQLIMRFIGWHNIFEDLALTSMFINTLMYLLITIFMIPLYSFLMSNIFFSEDAKLNATDLWRRYSKFKQHSSIFES